VEEEGTNDGIAGRNEAREKECEEVYGVKRERAEKREGTAQSSRKQEKVQENDQNPANRREAVYQAGTSYPDF
jgi:hypothetical protein